MKTSGVQEEDGRKVTPSILKSSLNPVVSIKRIPALDEAALASSSTKNVPVTSATTPSCFLCCEATLLNSLTQGRPHYLRQIQLFKTYLPQNDEGDKGSDGSLQTCAKCLQDVKQVWHLNQQIEAIRENIATIVDRVVALRTKTREGPQQSAEISNNGDLLDAGSVGQGFDAEVCVKVKEEIPCTEDGNTVNQSYFEELIKIESEEVSGEQEEEQSLLEEVKLFPKSKAPNPFRRQRLKRQKRFRRDSPAVGEEDSNSEQDAGEGGERLPSYKRFKQNETKLVCHHCGKMYSGRNSLRVHTLAVHIRQPLKCEFCEKTFVAPNKLSLHVKWVHTRETFPCSLCGKQLATRRRWAIHEALVCKVPHKGWGPEKLETEFNVTLITCPVQGCGKQFDSLQPSNLKAHLCAIHSLNPELRRKIDARKLEYSKKARPFACLLCQPPKRFTETINLTRHNSRYHPLSTGNRGNSTILPP